MQIQAVALSIPFEKKSLWTKNGQIKKRQTIGRKTSV